MKLKGHVYLCFINNCIKEACKACGIKLDAEALALDMYKAAAPICRTGDIQIVGDVVYVEHLESYMKGYVKEEGVQYRVSCIFTYVPRRGLTIYISKLVKQGSITRNASLHEEAFNVPISINEAMSKAFARGGNAAVVEKFFGV